MGEQFDSGIFHCSEVVICLKCIFSTLVSRAENSVIRCWDLYSIAYKSEFSLL